MSTSVKISRPQANMLRALAAAKGPLSKDQLAERSGVHESWVTEYAGTVGCERMVRRGGQLTDLTKLVPAGLAEVVDFPEVGRCWRITKAGREHLASAAG